jgi:drug/metabolite transporter (DMT)-like permease
MGAESTVAADRDPSPSTSTSRPPGPARSPAAALTLMATSAILFALMNLLARLATTSAPWATVAAVRATVGVFVAFTVARIRGRSLAATNRKAIFWRSLFGTISMTLSFYALSSRTVSLGNTVTLLNLVPLFIAILAPIFLRESTSPLVAVAIAVAFTGVIFIVRPTFIFGGGEEHGLGVAGPSATMTTIAAVCAACASSIAMMLLRRVGQTESAEVIAFHFSIFAAVTMTIIASFHLRVPSTRDALCMLGAGVCAGLGQLGMTRAYALEHAARVSGMGYLSVVASALLGALLLGEHPTSTAILGMGLVIAGGLLVTLRGASLR